MVSSRWCGGPYLLGALASTLGEDSCRGIVQTQARPYGSCSTLQRLTLMLAFAATGGERVRRESHAVRAADQHLQLSNGITRASRAAVFAAPGGRWVMRHTASPSRQGAATPIARATTIGSAPPVFGRSTMTSTRPWSASPSEQVPQPGLVWGTAASNNHSPGDRGPRSRGELRPRLLHHVAVDPDDDSSRCREPRRRAANPPVVMGTSAERASGTGPTALCAPSPCPFFSSVGSGSRSGWRRAGGLQRRSRRRAGIRARWLRQLPGGVSSGSRW